MDSFGDNIRAAREQRDLKQINVANACNMKQQYISDLERNKKKPSDKTLRRIAEMGLNMTLDELKNLDTLVQHNTDQQGGSAANVIVQQASDTDTIQLALGRAYEDLEYWKKKAEEGETWKERAIAAEAQLALVSKSASYP